MAARRHRIEHRNRFAFQRQAQRHHLGHVGIVAAIEQVDDPALVRRARRADDLPVRDPRPAALQQSRGVGHGISSLHSGGSATALAYLDCVVAYATDTHLAPAIVIPAVAPDALSVTDHALAVLADPMRLHAVRDPEQKPAAGGNCENSQNAGHTLPA